MDCTQCREQGTGGALGEVGTGLVKTSGVAYRALYGSRDGSITRQDCQAGAAGFKIVIITLASISQCKADVWVLTVIHSLQLIQCFVQGNGHAHGSVWQHHHGFVDVHSLRLVTIGGSWFQLLVVAAVGGGGLRMGADDGYAHGSCWQHRHGFVDADILRLVAVGGS